MVAKYYQEKYPGLGTPRNLLNLWNKNKFSDWRTCYCAKYTIVVISAAIQQNRVLRLTSSSGVVMTSLSSGSGSHSDTSRNRCY